MRDFKINFSYHTNTKLLNYVKIIDVERCASATKITLKFLYVHRSRHYLLYYHVIKHKFILIKKKCVLESNKYGSSTAILTFFSDVMSNLINQDFYPLPFYHQ